MFLIFADEFCQCRNGDRKIPLLETVFDEFPNHPINLDVKTYNEELMQLVRASLVIFSYAFLS